MLHTASRAVIEAFAWKIPLKSQLALQLSYDVIRAMFHDLELA